jgi:hypothetical protein
LKKGEQRSKLNSKKYDNLGKIKKEEKHENKDEIENCTFQPKILKNNMILGGHNNIG